jgi:hypothetical protein
MIANSLELGKTFDTLGASVGPRRGPDRRTKDQKEWYCLRRYLLTLAAHDRLSYPLDISKSERPDFIVGSRGVEVTEATEEDWQRELTESEASKGDCLTEAKLIGDDGFVGEQPEIDWCAAVTRAVNSKVDSLNSPSYPVASCDLLIYVNSRMSLIVDELRAIEVLAEASKREMERWKACARLGRIAILTNRRLLPNLLSSVEALSVIE